MTRDQFIWQLDRTRRQLGIYGVCGAAMLAISFVLALFSVLPAWLEVRALDQSLQTGRQQSKALQSPGGQPASSLTIQQMPASTDMSAQMRRVHELADQRGLGIGRAEYRLSPMADSALMQYEMLFSLSADYPRLRQYLADILAQLPNAALQEIEMTRPDVNAGEITAKVVLAFYYRRAEP